MNQFRTDVQTNAAQLAKDILSGALGDTATYSDHSEAAVTLVVLPGPENRTMTRLVDVQCEETRRPFWVPKQTSFPPSDAGGISLNGVIVYDSITYRINNWTNADSVGGLYRLDCIATRIRQMGMV